MSRTVIAPFVGAGLLQGIEQVAGQIESGSNWGPVGHGVSPRSDGDALLGLLILPLIHG